MTTVREAAKLLGVSPPVVHRLVAAGFLTLPIETNKIVTLAKALPPRIEDPENVLVVSLAPARQLTLQENVDDGGWRESVGFSPTLNATELANSSRGWWRSARPPRILVATVAGGWVVGAWAIRAVEQRRLGGFFKFELASDRAIEEMFAGTRIPLRPGPVARMLDQALS